MTNDPYAAALDEFHGAIERRTGRLQQESPVEQRAKFIIEEAIEADEALRATDDLGRAPADLGHTAKELADCVYVLFGTARRLDIPLWEVFKIVHASNMGKVRPGYSEDANGKIIKPDDYVDPTPAIRQLLSGVRVQPTTDGTASDSSDAVHLQTLSVDGVDVDLDKAADAVRRCVSMYYAIEDFKRRTKRPAQRTLALLDNLQTILRGEDAETDQD